MIRVHISKGVLIVLTKSPKISLAKHNTKNVFTPLSIWEAALHMVIQGSRLFLSQYCDFLRKPSVLHWIFYIQPCVKKIKIIERFLGPSPEMLYIIFASIDEK